MRTEDFFKWYEDTNCRDYYGEQDYCGKNYSNEIVSDDDIEKPARDYFKGMEKPNYITIKAVVYTILADSEFVDWANEPIWDLEIEIKDRFFGGKRGLIRTKFDYEGYIREIEINYDENKYHCKDKLIKFLEDKQLSYVVK